jgi:hypothetical protein
LSPLKSLDLSFVRSHAFQLSRDLMVTVFAADGKYGVLPSDEIDADDDLAIVHDSFRGSGVPLANCRRKGGFAAVKHCMIRHLSAAPLPPLLFAAGRRVPAKRRAKKGNEGQSPGDWKSNEEKRNRSAARTGRLRGGSRKGELRHRLRGKQPAGD